ncbi:MAG: hypothetical protein ACOCV2_04760, partial [Persicimonas sp.]
MKRHFYILLTLLAFLAAGCATGAGGPTYDWPDRGPAAQTADAWFEGDDLSQDIDTDEASLEEIFVAAEAAFWAGEVERAVDLYLAMLRREPGHALNRHVAGRLYALRGDVIDYEERLDDALAEVELAEVEPLGRLYLTLIARHLELHDWRNSTEAAPFSGDRIGFPTAWRATPALSHWRLADFDRSFSVEDEPAFADEYRAPYVAEDDPSNVDRVRPIQVGSAKISPNLRRSGVHYLETFVTVDESDEGGARDFLVYGNFPSAARVWIGGKEVFERGEDDYSSGKRFRRVRLEPGEHRVLVKLAYDDGYRDWFDLLFLADETAGGSGVNFARTPRDDRQSEGSAVSLEGEQMMPSELEPLLVEPDEVDRATDLELFLTANAAYMDLEPRFFDAAIEELLERREEFVPAYL